MAAVDNPIIEVANEEAWNQLKQTDKLIVVQFSAGWCGPCKQIKPHLEKLAGAEQDVVFCKVDADAAEEQNWEWARVENLPTFRFIRDGVELGQYSGSKIEKVVENVNNFK